MPSRAPAVWLLTALTLVGCGAEPEPSRTTAPPVPTTSTTAVNLPTTTSTAPPAVSTTLPPPLRTTEDARQLLERHGVDQDALAREIGEHMERRFHPAPEEAPKP